MLDAAFAQRQSELFDDDWKRAKPMTLQAWRQRPWREKVIERASSLLGAQL